jgi:hypothetical protein
VPDRSNRPPLRLRRIGLDCLFFGFDPRHTGRQQSKPRERHRVPEAFETHRRG